MGGSGYEIRKMRDRREVRWADLIAGIMSCSDPRDVTGGAFPPRSPQRLPRETPLHFRFRVQAWEGPIPHEFDGSSSIFNRKTRSLIDILIKVSMIADT